MKDVKIIKAADALTKSINNRHGYITITLNKIMSLIDTKCENGEFECWYYPESGFYKIKDRICSCLKDNGYYTRYSNDQREGQCLYIKWS